MLFLAIPILIGIPGGVYVTAYRATGRLARGMMVNNAVRLIGLLCFIVVLALGLTPLVFAVATLAQSLILSAVMVLDLVRQVPFARRAKLNLQMAWMGRQHLSGSLFFWILALANALNYQGIILVLNANVAPALIALYVTQRTAAGLIGYISNLIQPPLWAELTFLHARQRHEDLVRVVLLSVKIVSLLSSIAGVGLWILLPIVYPLWTNGQLHFDPLLFAVILVQTVLFAEWMSCGWVLMASNQHRSLAGWALGNAVITLSLAVLLAPRFNILGVAVATLLGDIVCGLLIYPRLAAHVLNISANRLYGSMLLPMFVTLISGLVILKLVASLSPVIAILVSGILLAGTLGLAVQLVFTPDEMKWLRSNLRQVARQRAELSRSI
jgi:O-antigen/teichoic acid export membrane protein